MPKLIPLLIICVFSFPLFCHGKFGASVGAAGIVRNNIRLGNNISNQDGDYTFQGFPGLGLNYGNLSLRGPRLNYRWWSGATEFNTFINWDGDQYRSTFISERRQSFFAGGYLRILFLHLDFSNDFTGKSHGNKASLAVGKRFSLTDKWMIALKGGYEYLSENYVDYYYGVKAEEAIEFEQYTGDRSFHPKVDMANFFFLTKKLNLNLISTFRLYSSRVQDSPTVRKNEEFSVLFLISYNLI